MKHLQNQITKIAQDLTHLEINVIIKPNLTARKMPSPRHALIDIAEKYHMKLMVLGFSFQDEKNLKDGYRDQINDATVKLGSLNSFDLLREKANAKIKTSLHRKIKATFS